MKYFGVGLLLGVVLMIGVPLVILGFGLVDFAASTPAGFVERHLAPWAVDRSIDRRAGNVQNPSPATPAVLERGLAHYRGECLVCHGAPGLGRSDISRGLSPGAPPLGSRDVQASPDGTLFWVVKHGIRMTGMPAFGLTHGDNELWSLVRFVRHLNALTGAEVKELGRGLEGEREEHRPM